MQFMHLMTAGVPPKRDAWLNSQQTTKLLRIMRLTAIILLTACITASAGSKAQTIKLDVKDAPLEKVFAQIKKQSGYSFVYYKDDLPKGEKITLRLTSSNIEEVLQQVLKGQPLSYTIVDKTVVIKQKSPNADDHSLTTSNSPLTTSLIDITGKVTDADGNPLAGASVKVKGTSNGTTTNNDGVFVLKRVDENATLEISFVGYETYTVAVNNKSSIIASLKLKPESLNEVVINKGYYTEKQKFSVGNVGKVTSKEIEKQPVQNPLLALQGRVPGLIVTQNSGVPGGGITVRVQGQNSIDNGNDPLIIIDGIPYPSQLSPVGSQDAVLGTSAGITGPGTNGNPLNFINPLDIESVEVLKDADATAIYGSRAANGALLITTKKGRNGKARLDVNVQQGWGKVTRTMKMLNRRQYLDMRYEAFKNDGVDVSTLTQNSRTWDLTVWDTTRYTDWQKVLIGRTAKYTNVNTSVSGGNSGMQYLVSGTYHKESTVFLGDFADQKASMHFNLNTSSNQRFYLQFSGSYMFDDNKLPGIDLTRDANLLEPIAPALLNPDGSLNWAPRSNGNSTWEIHPLANVLYSNYQNKTHNLVSNLQLNYSIVKGLDVKTSFGYTYLQSNDFTSIPLISQKPEFRPFIQRSATHGSRLMRSWTIEPQIIYKTYIGKGQIETLLGSSLQQSRNNSGSILGEGYNSDLLLKDYRAASKLTAASSYISEYKYNGLFGRINYQMSERYIINIVARRDGSSRFGSKNLFHNFGSVGAAWIFSEGKFFKNKISFLSFGKLRMSYGSTGNDQIPDYQFLSVYASSTPGVPYQGSPGLYPFGIPNPYLQWEETKKIQGGIDLGFLKDRILLNATYVRNRSSNQLVQYILSTVTGNNSLTQNFPATIQNTSLEFSLFASAIKNKNLEWTTNLNVTIPDNKLVNFPNIEKTAYNTRLRVGYPLSSNRYYEFLGVDPATGLYLVSDRKGNATMTPDAVLDKTKLITKMAKIYGGLQNRLSFRSIELEFLLQFVKQDGVNNFFNNGTAVAPGLFISGSSNQPVSVLNRWQKPGDNAIVQRFSATNTGQVYEQLGLAQGGSMLITDASFIRLKNVALSCKLPASWQQKIHSQGAKVFAQAQNLLTITNYKGADPENQGYTTLPPLRVITAGVQIVF
jgi:TonB-dependent starch-binding outer membrane protein SusC